MEGDAYSEGQAPSTGDQFGQMVFDMWKETTDISMEVRYNLMGDKKDGKTLNDFIVHLTTLWVQLKPKVVGMKFKNKGLEKDFKGYEKYSTNPKKLTEVASDAAQEEIIFQLEATVREVIEELGITDWGRRR
jgi:hypothetical protein